MADQAVTVDIAISEFMTSLWQAVAIILAVSFISLGVRPGFVIASAIPLTLAVVFSVMDIVTSTCSAFRSGALIIALALMVDDAMTTTDAMLNRLAAGDDKVDGRDLRVPHLCLRDARRHIGHDRRLRPCRLRGKLGAANILFAFCRRRDRAGRVLVRRGDLRAVARRRHPDTAQGGEESAEPGFVFRAYSRFLTGPLRARWLTIAVTLALFIASFLAMPLIPNQFFPSSDRPELLVDLSLPQNASIYASEDVAERFDDVLKDDKDVARWSTYVGRGAIRFYLPLNVQLAEQFLRQAVIVAKDVPGARSAAVKLEKLLANEFPSLVSRVYPLELGPPVGWPVQYRVSGPDISQGPRIALKLAQVIAANPQAAHINFDWIEPARQIRIRSTRTRRGCSG